MGLKRIQDPCGVCGLPTSVVVPASTAPLVSSMIDVDLDAIASSGFAVQGSRDMEHYLPCSQGVNGVWDSMIEYHRVPSNRL